MVALAGSCRSLQLIAKNWQTLNLGRQRAILKAILESVQVDAVIKKGVPPKPSRLCPVWKFWRIRMRETRYLMSWSDLGSRAWN